MRFRWLSRIASSAQTASSFIHSDIEGSVWIGEYFGDVMFVNGHVWPYPECRAAHVSVPDLERLQCANREPRH